MTANDLAAQFITSATWDHLPGVVQEKVRMCLVDSLGAALAGTLVRISQIGAAYAAEAWPGDEATILFDGTRSSATGAAFANGCAANALDVDDSTRYAYGHAGVQIFATALAVAEARRLTGAKMLTGMVVGYEIAHRVGRCWHASRSMYQACSSWGSVACAAVAAHLKGLPAGQARHALGIAEYYAPNLPMMRDVDHPGMVKHGIEWAAMTGIISAELAGRGFTGIPSLLGFEAYRPWVLDIGEQYWMADWVTYDSGIVERGAEKWSQAMVEDKFRRQASHALPSGASVIEAIMKMAQSFEDVADVRYLTCLL